MILSWRLDRHVEVELDLHEWVPDLTQRWSGGEVPQRASEEASRLGGEWPSGEQRDWEPHSTVRHRVGEVLSGYDDRGLVAVVCHSGVIEAMTGEGQCPLHGGAVLTMTRSLDVGLDVDGVLYPFSQVIAEYATGALGRTCSADAETFDWYRGWGLTTEEFLALCGRSALEGVLFTEGDPLPGALAAAETLSAQGHRLHYVTARAIGGVSPPTAWRLTAAWLLAWGFPVHSLTVSEDKACRPTDVFLDDGPHLYDALVNSGHPRPVLWSHPCTLTHPAERVHTWAEFHAIVDDIARSDAAPRPSPYLG